MKQGCIRHIPNTAMAILRADYLAICDDDKGAALLLSQFEYFHDVKLEKKLENTRLNAVAERHGDEPTQDVGLYQFYTADQLGDLVLGGVGRDAIEKGLTRLVKKGFVTVHKNPNPRYKFDSTRHFLFHPNVVNEKLDSTKSVRSDYGIRPTVKRNLSNGRTESVGTSPKTSLETTEETTEKEDSLKPVFSKSQKKKTAESKEGPEPSAEAREVVQLLCDVTNRIPNTVPQPFKTLEKWARDLEVWRESGGFGWEVVKATVERVTAPGEWWATKGILTVPKLIEHWNKFQGEMAAPKGGTNGRRTAEPRGAAGAREFFEEFERGEYND